MADQPSFLTTLHHHMPTTPQLVGFLALVASAFLLLVFSGVALTATALGVLFFAPLVVLTSPVWVPVGTVLFVAIAGVLAVAGGGVVAAAAAMWTYKYVKGRRPVGSERVDYARSRIVDTARDYGGLLHSKVKDAAPGA